MLLQLFLSFFKIGLVSFGGGYAMIPVIEYEAVQHGWLTSQAFADGVSVAGMSPGPIATNTAVFVGYKVAGIFGAIVAAVGVSLPSLLLILVIGMVFYKIKDHIAVRSVLYGLRPVITAFVLYAAVRFVWPSEDHFMAGWETIGISITMVIAALGLLMKIRLHPLLLLLCFGALGMVGGWAVTLL